MHALLDMNVGRSMLPHQRLYGAELRRLGYQQDVVGDWMMYSPMMDTDCFYACSNPAPLSNAGERYYPGGDGSLCLVSSKNTVW